MSLKVREALRWPPVPGVEGSIAQEVFVAGWLARGVGGAHGWLGWLEGGWLWARVVQMQRRGGVPLHAAQSVLRFEVWFNEIKRLQAKMSKRITLCLRGDPGKRLPRFQ